MSHVSIQSHSHGSKQQNDNAIREPKREKKLLNLGINRIYDFKNQ